MIPRSFRLTPLTLAFALGAWCCLGSAVRADVRATGAGGLGTKVNGEDGGVCNSGNCHISGGTDTGRNRFHRFKDFDTRGAITGINFDTGGKRNLVVGVTAPGGTYLNKQVSLSSPANLFWLSPGGIHLGAGVGFVNTSQLHMSTASSLRFNSGAFNVFDSTPQQLAGLGTNPLPGSHGLVTDPQRLAELGMSATPRILLEGIDISVDQSLLVDAPGGSVEVVDSKLSASSEKAIGGKITLTADQVRIDGDSQLLATGATGGGLIQVGGSWQNSDSSVRQAVSTTIESGALLDASALDHGDGGTIVAWSDLSNLEGLTEVAGTFLSRGGIYKGDGGKIETSGAYVDIEGILIDTIAFKGDAGEWLIDPYDYQIDSSNSSGILSTLTNGTNVTIDTANAANTAVTPNVTGWTSRSTTGDIAINIDLNYSTGSGTLILNAADQVDIGSGKTVTTGSGGLQVNATNGLKGSGNISAPSGATIQVDQSGDSTYSGNISGGGGLAKLGTGALTLSGSNSYTGDTNLSAGGLVLGSTGSLASSTDLSISSGATFDTPIDLTIRSLSGAGTFNLSNSTADLFINVPSGATAQTFSGVLQASNTTSRLNKQGPGTQILSGSNTYAGNTIVEEGILRVSSQWGLGTAAGGTYVKGGASVAGVLEFIGGASESSELEIAEPIFLNYSGGTEHPTLRAYSGYTELTNTVALEGDSIIDANSSSNLLLDPGSGYAIAVDTSLCTSSNTCNLTVSGSGDVATDSGHGIDLFDGTDSFGVTKSGSGTFKLAGASDMQAPIAINGGVLDIAHTQALGGVESLSFDAGTLKFSVDVSDDSTYTYALGSGGGTIDVDSGKTAGLSGVISGSGALTKSGSGTLDLSGINTFTGATSVAGGILKLSNSNVFTGTTSFTIDAATLQISANVSDASTDTFTLGSGGATFDVDSGMAAIFSGAISGSGSLTKDGSGSLTLSGSNTYSGQTFVNNGTFAVTSSNPSSSTTTCSSDATCTFPSSDSSSSSIDSSTSFTTTTNTITITITTTTTTTNTTTSITDTATTTDTSLNTGTTVVVGTSEPSEDTTATTDSVAAVVLVAGRNVVDNFDLDVINQSTSIASTSVTSLAGGTSGVSNSASGNSTATQAGAASGATDAGATSGGADGSQAGDDADVEIVALMAAPDSAVDAPGVAVDLSMEGSFGMASEDTSTTTGTTGTTTGESGNAGSTASTSEASAEGGSADGGEAAGAETAGGDESAAAVGDEAGGDGTAETGGDESGGGDEDATAETGGDESAGEEAAGDEASDEGGEGAGEEADDEGGGDDGGEEGGGEEGDGEEGGADDAGGDEAGDEGGGDEGGGDESADEGGEADSSEGSSRTATQLAVTQVTSEEAVRNVATADKQATTVAIQKLGLADREASTPTTSELQNSLQQAVNRFGGGGQ